MPSNPRERSNTQSQSRVTRPTVLHAQRARVDVPDVERGINYSPAQRTQHHGSLLAIFPLAHHLRGCLAIALSIDGLHWSRVTPLLACGVRGERALDHPVAGGAVFSPAAPLVGSSTPAPPNGTRAIGNVPRSAGRVLFFIQHNVQGIAHDKMTPVELGYWASRREPHSSLVRYSVPCERVALWTSHELRALGGGVGSDSDGGGSYVCPAVECD